jgi:hypothetical protein
MPRSPEQLRKHSLAMKAYWRKKRQQQHASIQNGHLVENRIVLHVQDQELTLTVPEASALRDALSEALPHRKSS